MERSSHDGEPGRAYAVDDCRHEEGKTREMGVSSEPEQENRPELRAARWSWARVAQAGTRRRAGAAPASARRRLFRRYLTVLVGLVGGAVLVSSLVGVYFTYRDTRQNASRLLQEKAEQAADPMSDTAFQVALSLMGPIEEALGPQAFDPLGRVTLAERHSAYRRGLDRPSAYRRGLDRPLDPGVRVRSFTYLDASAREQLHVYQRDAYGSDVVGRGRDRSGDPLVRAVRRDGYAFGPVRWHVYGEFPLITAGVLEPAGGMTLADIDALSLLQGSPLPPNGDFVFYVVDRSGALLAPDDVFGFPAAGSDISRLSQVREALAGPAAPGLPGGSPFSPGSRSPPESSAEPAVYGVDPSGPRAVLTTSAILAGLGWHVFVEQPYGAALAPVHSALWRAGLFLGVFLALGVAASYLLARRMARPMEELSAAATAIGAGAFDERAEVKSGDELEDLAAAFNRMAERLQELYASLERRVDERTRELTETLQQNARLVRALEVRSRELELASRHKSAFLADMSHELRTPLNAIIGFSEVLRMRMAGELTERQAEYLDDIHASGRHLLALISDILDLAKVEAGRLDLEPAPLDLRSCLEAGFTMVRERAERRGVELTLEIEDVDGPVVADERRLTQIVSNLLDNAVRFSPEGDRVAVTVRRVDAEVRIAVHDAGPGIPQADQERIFEEFEQAGTPEPGEGTGLGLALSRRLAELHGGRLWVESRPGAGSTFVLALPAGAPAPTATA